MMTRPRVASLVVCLSLQFGIAVGDAAPVADAAAPVVDAEGYIDLFASGDFSRWRFDGVNDDDRNRQKALWSIEDGVIAAAGRKYGFIRFDERICNFSVKLEYRLQKGGNSGIGIRGAIYRGGGSRPSKSGYELQLLDDAGKRPHKHSSMSLYRYVAPTENAVHPAGEWNQIEITCQGPRIRVVTNGKTVQDVDQSAIDAIKNKPLCGYFLLQNHGAPVDFRNVRFKPLDGDP